MKENLKEVYFTLNFFPNSFLAVSNELYKIKLKVSFLPSFLLSLPSQTALWEQGHRHPQINPPEAENHTRTENFSSCGLTGITCLHESAALPNKSICEKMRLKMT